MKNTLITLASLAALTGAANAQTIENPVWNPGATMGDRYAEFSDGIRVHMGTTLGPGTLGTVGTSAFGVSSWAVPTNPTNVMNWNMGGYADGADSVTLLFNDGSTTLDTVNYNYYVEILMGSSAIPNLEITGTGVPILGSGYSVNSGVTTIDGGSLVRLNYQLTADATSSLVFTTTDGADINDTLGSISIAAVRQPVAVPEPSSTALLGLGGLALILRRKK